MSNYTWSEADHPRDNEGKFTYKNGGGYHSSKDDLIKRQIEKENKEQKEAERRAEILYPTMKNKGGIIEQNKPIFKYATAKLGGDVLKQDVEQGTPTGGASEYKDMYNTKSEKPTINDKIKQIKYELGIGPMYALGGYSYAKDNFGSDTVGMIDLAHKNPKNPEYTKDAIKYKNYEDPNLAKDKIYFERKLSKEFRDYGYDIKDIKGYEFKSYSEPSQRILNDPDFIKSIENQKEEILKGKEASGYFPEYADRKKSNLHYAIGHYDLRHGLLDSEGNLHVKVYDTYDFNKNNFTPINQAGRSQMMKGNLQPYFTIHDIIVPKSTLDKIW